MSLSIYLYIFLCLCLSHSLSLSLSWPISLSLSFLINLRFSWICFIYICIPTKTTWSTKPNFLYPSLFLYHSLYRSFVYLWLFLSLYILFVLCYTHTHTLSITHINNKHTHKFPRRFSASLYSQISCISFQYLFHAKLFLENIKEKHM